VVALSGCQCRCLVATVTAPLDHRGRYSKQGNVGGNVEQEVVGVVRFLTTFAWITALLILLPNTAGAPGNLALVTAVAAALTVAVLVACLDHRQHASSRTVVAAGLVSDERRLHGSFRRLSSPDTPGRPRPRAPGAGRPA
jgi:hypothetical protein